MEGDSLADRDKREDVADSLLRSRPDLEWLADDLRNAEPLDVGQPLVVGQRVRVYGGYDAEPAWLAGSPDGYLGTVVAFIPGWDVLPSAVVEADQDIRIGSDSGRFLVLTQAWEGVPWGQSSPRVHVELCSSMPEPQSPDEREHGAWVESHASFDAIAS